MLFALEPAFGMNAKKTFVIGVLAALFVWTGIETYRYWDATNQLAASLERQRTVEARLAQLKSVRVAAQPAADTKP